MKGNPLQLIQYLYEQDKTKVYEVKEYKPKRSLQSNNYAWELMEQIAQVLRTSKDEVYEQMLQDYGTLLRDENGELYILVSKGERKSKADLHLKYIGKRDINGSLTNLYAVIKGSSQYDSKEMSVFIEGVRDEAIELGIPVMTPEEMANLKSLERELKC